MVCLGALRCARGHCVVHGGIVVFTKTFRRSRVAFQCTPCSMQCTARSIAVCLVQHYGVLRVHFG